MRATTATEGDGSKSGFNKMGPVDGSVRTEEISRKNAMEQERCLRTQNSGEAYLSLSRLSLLKEDVKHMKDSDGNESKLGEC